MNRINQYLFNFAALFSLFLSLNFNAIGQCNVSLSYQTQPVAGGCCDYSLDMFDSFGDGWNGAYVTVNGVQYTLSSGSSGSVTITLCNGDPIDIDYPYSGSWPSEVSYDFLDPNGVILYSSPSGPAVANNVYLGTAACITYPPLDCNGGNIVLTAAGQGAATGVFSEDFNGGANPGWSSTGGATFGQPCGAGIGGSDYYWASTATGTPQLTTNGFDMSCGGVVCFDMVYSVQGGAVPCEGPDLPDEGVTFQYSTNGGATWNILDYWDPLGGYDPTLTSWNNYCFTLPPDPTATNMQFQWIQTNSSGTCCDNWGVDNVVITSNDCSGYVYNYTYLPPWDDGNTQTTNVTSTTTYGVWFSDGVDSCYASTTVVVPPGTTADAGPDQTLCYGASSVTIGGNPVSPDEGATFNWDNGAGSGTIDLTNPGIVNGQESVSPATTTTYTVTVDYNGCSATDQVTVFVDMPPTASNPAPINVQCAADVPAPNPAVVTDEADDYTTPPTVTWLNDVSNGLSCPETITRTYRVTDGCGNYVDVQQTITINDTQAPVLAAAPANVTVQCPADVPADPGLGWTDNCDGSGTVIATDVSNGLSCPETITRTWTYTDACGNTASAQQIITVHDTQAPTLSGVPADINVQCPADVPAMVNVTWNDNCDGTGSIIGSEVSDGNTCPETITRTWTYTDACGNNVTQSQTITVHDTQAPTLSGVPADISVQCPGDVPAMVNVTWNDNCDGTGSIIGSEVSDGNTCPETITRTWTYTDACGNNVTQSQTITVHDTQAPVFAAPPADITVDCVGDIPADPGLTWTDNCDGTGSVVGTDSGLSGGCPATMTRTWTYTDACGNTTTVVQNITVDDQTAPVFAAPPADLTVECSADVPAAVGLGWTDNCDGSGTAVATEVSDGNTCPETITRTWTYTDACGNNATVQQVITVHDLTPPVFAAPPADVTVECPGDVPAMTDLAWTDNCDGSGTVTGTDGALTGGNCGGTIIRTWTYTDACGNTTSVTQTITVDDTTPPTASNPVGQVGTPPPPDPNVVIDEADNCGVPTVLWVSDVSDGGVCPEIITRTYSVTDGCGNQITVTQTFTIGDAILPTASNPLPISVECLADVPAPDPLVVTDENDNGAPPIVTFESDSTDGNSCPETIYRKYKVTDDCGNYIFVTQTITIVPVTPPVVPADGASTVNCLSDAQVQPTAPAVTDVCGNAITPTVVTPPNIVCEGDMAWVFTYTDCAGNSTDWTYTYTVDLPAFTIPYANGASTVNCSTDAGIQPADPGVVTDMCGNTLTPVVTPPAAVACEGDMVWTFTYTDCAGNTADWTYTYTVSLPAFTIPYANGASTVNCPADASVQPADPGVVTDMCGNTLTPVVTAPAAVACEGDMVWTFTYTDCAGNTADWIYTYTVDLPAFTIPYAAGASTVNCPADANVQPADPGVVTDLCGNTITPVVTAPSAVGCEGDMIWTFTYTDCAGNTADWLYTYTVDMPAFTIPYANGSGSVSCPVDATDPGAPGPVVDMCGNTITPVVTPPASVGCSGGTMDWVYTYTDCAGNTADWIFSYTVNMLPFTLPADGASTVTCVSDAQVQPTSPAITDLCGNAIVPTVVSPTAVVCEGDMIWTFTYTDCAGNTADWLYTYTVDYTGALTPPANGASTVNCAVDAIDPGAPADILDACGNPVSAVLVGSSAAPACEGDIVWTYQYTSCDGLTTADWTYTYTIDIPAFTIPYAAGASTVNCPADASVQPADPGVVTDMCGNTLTPVVTAPAAVACEGDMVWTFTYTDCAGNTADWLYTYTVDMPAFTIPYAAGASTVNCPADASVQPADPGVVTDMCGNTITPVVTAPSAVACEGDMVWTFTYTDCAGNTADWLYTYTVDMPAFTIPYANGSGTVSCPVDATDPGAPGPVVDMCGNTITPVVTPPASVGCSGGTMDWVYTYTDCAGNTADWIYSYTVAMPSFTLPADDASTVNCIADAQVQPTSPVMVDMCGNSITPVVTAPTAVACEGDMIWTFTYTDCAGNTADWLYTYTVDLPAFTIPYANGASTVNCLADASVQPADPGVVTDMCGNTLTPVVTAPAAVACEGDMIWTFTYTDCAGNTADWIYTYTVDLPTFTIPYAAGSSTVNCPADASVQPADPGVVMDMCGNTLAPVVTAPAAVACEGDMVWTFTYTDCAGNTADWIYTYTVDLPAFTIPYAAGASTVNCPADANVQPAGPGVVTDLCGNTITPVITAPSTVGCEGDMIWTFTYTDCAGNTADWLYTYTVDLPAFTIPYAAGASTVNCPADANVQPADPGVVTDLCGNTITPVITAPSTVGCEGDMIWTFTYTDCAGNTADWIYTYTVNLPTFTIPYANSGSTVNCIADANVQPADPGIVTDMCGNTLTPIVYSPLNNVPCEGDMIWTFTYTDCAGNTANWLYTYTVDLPPFTLPADVTENVVCFADIYVPTPPANVTDVCGNVLTPVMTQGPDPTCVGNKVFTFTYTDCANNTADWTYTFSINDNVPPTASNPATVTVSTVQQVPAPDPAVVTDEADNCTTNPTVAFVSETSDGNLCPETLTRVYSVTDDCGNTINVTQTIIITGVYPPVDAGEDDIICAGESVTLTADNPMGAVISWDNGVIDGVSFAPGQTMTYTVTANNLGCITTDDVTISVEDLPLVSFYGDTLSGCEPLTVTFTNTSTTTGTLVNCVWDINGVELTGCDQVTYAFQNGGTYDVTLTTTSAIGCTSTMTYDDYIYVEDLPIASFDASSSSVNMINTQVSFTNTSTGAVDYEWTFSDNGSSTNEFEPIHIFPNEEPGDYNVQLVAYSPLGCTDTAWMNIEVEEELIFYIPNTFTPDDDGHNETFKAVFYSGYDPYQYTMFIFNRWGEIVWECHDVSVGWDGSYGGNIVQDGTYTWKIEFKTTMNDEHKMYTGHVNIIR